MKSNMLEYNFTLIIKIQVEWAVSPSVCHLTVQMDLLPQYHFPALTP